MSYYSEIGRFDIYHNQGNKHIIYSDIPDKKTCDSSLIMIFDNNFNCPLNNDLYQSSTILSIKFGQSYNQSVYRLPKLVKYIEFGDAFNQTVNYLPKNTKGIKFGHNFNNEVVRLPHELEIVEFGASFDKNVDHLPNTLKSIKFGILFNQTIDKLPSSLISLVMGGFFNQSIDNLPRSLKKIVLGYGFNKKVNVDKLPKTIENITIMSTYHYLDQIRKDLPSHIALIVMPTAK